MSFFKKLTSEFEGLSTKDKDRATGSGQQQQYGQGQYIKPLPPTPFLATKNNTLQSLFVKVYPDTS